MRLQLRREDRTGDRSLLVLAIWLVSRHTGSQYRIAAVRMRGGFGGSGTYIVSVCVCVFIKGLVPEV